MDGTTSVRVLRTIQYNGNGTVYANYTRVNNESGSPTRERVEVWSNTTTARRVVTTPNETAVEELSPITDVPTFKPQVEAYLQLFGARTTGYSRLGGEQTVHITGRFLDRTGPWLTTVKQVYGFVAIDDGQFTADITNNVLRRYRVRLLGSAAPGSSAVTVVTVETVFTDMGATTIRRPKWITAADKDRGNTSSR